MQSSKTVGYINGFTMVEMVMIVVVVGVLAAIGFSKMTHVNELPAMTASDQLVAALQYSQALAQRQGVVTLVSFSNTQPNLIISQNATAVPMPNNQYPYTLSPDLYKVYFDSDVTLTSTTSAVTYDVNGTPGAAASFSVAKGGLSYTITLTATGYVYAN